MGQRLENIASSFKSAGTPDDVASNIVEKARKYFTTSFGTADDPLRVAILEGRLNPVVPSQYEFRDYLVDAAQASYRQQQDAGRGGVDDQLPVSSALEDFTRMYDRNTGLQGKVYTPTKPSYEEQTALEAGVRNRLIAEGVPEKLINPRVSVRGLDETSSMFGKEKLFVENLANTQDKTLAMALQKNEPIYDMDEYVSSAMSFLSPRNLAQAAQEIPLTTLEKMSFPELVIKTAEIRRRDAGLKDAIAKAKQNKKVLPKYFLNEGVKPVIDAGPNERWYQITDSKYTALEGNAMGHSVGGYAKQGAYNNKPREDVGGVEIGGKEAFDKGYAQVYTLRNTKTGLPAITVELQNDTPVSIGQTKNPQVSQIQGFKNGMPFSTEPVFKLLKKLGVTPENTPRSQGYRRNTKGEELENREFLDWRSMYQDYLAQNPGPSTFAKGGEVTSSRRMLENLIGKKPEGQRVDATGLLGFANGGEARVGGSAPAVAGRTGRAAQLAAQRADEPQTESRTMLERLGRFASLDTPQDMGLGETAADIGMGFLPVVGTAQGARDFERARRDEDKLGMLLSAASMIPVAGGAVRAVRSAGKASRAADDLAALTAQVPTDIPQPSAALDMPPLENAQRTQLGSSKAALAGSSQSTAIAYCTGRLTLWVHTWGRLNDGYAGAAHLDATQGRSSHRWWR
jgi:hypothetical protein